MRSRHAYVATIVPLFLGLTVPVIGQEPAVDPDALIDRVLMVGDGQHERLHNVVFDAEYVEGEVDETGDFVEKVRFVKKVYVKYWPDTAWYREEFLEYHKNGDLRSDKERDKEAAKRVERRRKQGARNISFSMLRPFRPEWATSYQIDYLGVPAEPIDGYVCHLFRVRAKREDKDLINGDYYFDAESFHIVRVNFSPAQLVKSTMFRLKELEMSIVYGPTPDGWWLPRQFDVRGKGKVAFLFGVEVAGTEYYRNPIVNGELSDAVFEVKDGG